MIDPQRALYARLGPLRYVWWLVFATAGERCIVPGRYSGFRWSLGIVLLGVSKLSWKPPSPC